MADECYRAGFPELAREWLHIARKRERSRICEYLDVGGES